MKHVDSNIYLQHTLQMSRTVEQTLVLHDGAFNDDDMPGNAEHTDVSYSSHSQDLLIYIKSGEYFSTLATLLDSISDRPEMQQIVHDLLYLQQHFKIVEK